MSEAKSGNTEKKSDSLCVDDLDARATFAREFVSFLINRGLKLVRIFEGCGEGGDWLPEDNWIVVTYLREVGLQVEVAFKVNGRNSYLIFDEEKADFICRPAEDRWQHYQLAIAPDKTVLAQVKAIAESVQHDSQPSETMIKLAELCWSHGVDCEVSN